MLSIQKRLTNTFYAILSLPATSMGFALSVQISALSWILSTQYGLDIEEVGLVWAAGPIAGILGQVIIGIISDKVWFWKGRRRPFILIGGTLAAISLLALPNIGVISTALGVDGILGVAITIALILDLAINISFNPTRSIIADVTPEGTERTKGYTWMQTISGLFGVLAYGIGAVWDNFVLIYVGVAVAFLFSVIPILFVEEPRELPGHDEDSGTDINDASFIEIMRTTEPLWGFLIYAIYALVVRLAHIEMGHYYVEYFCLGLTLILIFKSLLQSEEVGTREERGKKGFKKVLAAHSFTWVGTQTMFVYMFAFVSYKLPELDDIAMGQVVSWSFLVLNAVGALFPAFVLEPLAEKFGRVKTHIGSLAAMTLGFLSITILGNSPLIIYILMALTGIGWAATVSLPFAIMSEKISQNKMGLYMGLFNLAVVLPQLVSSVGIGKIINDTENKSIVFIICTVSLAISTILWFFVKEEMKGESESEEALTADS